MLLESLSLKDYRNYEEADVEFDDGLNLVVGRNGQGKTNLIEAIYFISRLSSWRPGPNQTLVMEGADRAIIRSASRSANRANGGSGDKGDRATQVDGEISASGYRVIVNGVPLDQTDRRALPLTVLFSPEDLALVKEGPELRRRYLDHLAGSLRPRATSERQEFEKVLRQRNGLLKAAQHNPRALKSLDAWDEQFIRTGTVVIKDRLAALEAISELASAHQSQVSSDRAQLGLTYGASWAEEPTSETAEMDLRTAIENNRPTDRDRGITHVGPHRDDLELSLGGSDARIFASQGQQRTISLALRLAERGAITEVRGEDPILLLDDVFSELDDQRTNRMAELVGSSGQSIATATSVAGIPVEANKVLSVAAGKVITKVIEKHHEEQ